MPGSQFVFQVLRPDATLWVMTSFALLTRRNGASCHRVPRFCIKYCVLSDFAFTSQGLFVRVLLVHVQGWWLRKEWGFG